MGTLALVVLTSAHAAKLVEVKTVDELHVMVTVWDSTVHYKDDGKGPTAFIGADTQGPDRLEKFGEPLSVTEAAKADRFLLRGTGDSNYAVPVAPVSAYRKTKVSGTAWGWPNPDPSFEHTLFLRFAKPLRAGARYELSLSPELKIDSPGQGFTFDPFKSETEALKVNLVGYPTDAPIHSADLYQWMGDGGPRDYKAYEGRTVWLVDVKTSNRTAAGKVEFWKPAGPNLGNWNTTASPVWRVDFRVTKPGRYRIAVEGIGASREFPVSADATASAFKTSVRGFYYMRIGEPMKLSPPPRQPRFIPNVDPPGFTVYLTTMGPWHPEWKTLPGDAWDVKDWSKWVEEGRPTNPNAYGGHSDAADWDRHLGHISIIWDLLLPYILTNGGGADDDTRILESGNGIPDALDEAQNEVDFWLRLRDRKGGYSSGLNNPSPDHKVMYQAAARPYMAWASAANAAMLADAYRIAKKPDLMRKYRDAALEAWGIANGEDLDISWSIGNGKVRGRDLKQMAAAYLYNVTGEKRFEDALAAGSVIKTATTPTEEAEKSNQLWGTAAYLMAAKYGWHPIRHPELLANMKAAVIHEAMTKNVANVEVWPVRRSADNAHGWFQTVTEVQRVCVAHAVSTNAEEKRVLLRALRLEADYSLGRNPINMVLMTGLGPRHVDDIYTSGRNDGVPGSHPGHTPYMNAEPWGEGFMFDPRWMASRGYPDWKEWPHGEAIWRARYCFANNEFTPQQSMRGKHCLYGYLHALNR